MQNHKAYTDSQTQTYTGDYKIADIQGVAGERLKQYVERIERLEEEKARISDDIKDVYAESKSAGFDPKIVRMIVRLRKMAADERREEQEF